MNAEIMAGIVALLVIGLILTFVIRAVLGIPNIQANLRKTTDNTHELIEIKRLLKEQNDAIARLALAIRSIDRAGE